MSKKRGATSRPDATDDWMTPLDPAAPCGVDLEYDPECVVLFAQAVARVDAQYGDFVGTAEPVNWSEIERDCRRLMQRSKDIRLAILFTRCRTRLASAHGLADGLGVLSAWLTAYGDTIHPQQGVDEDRDAAQEIRMNALQTLTDTNGLLADVRDIALVRSSVARLQVRDVERAFAQPRPSDALSAQSVSQQLRDLRIRQPDVLAGFDLALHSLGLIDAWNREKLGAFAADLAPLKRVLERVVGEGPVERAAVELEEPEEAEKPEQASSPANPSPIPDEPHNEITLPGRDAALHAIRDARHWFEAHEPSSPIPVLLRRAERFVGKRYGEAVKAIPAAVLAEWEAEP
ncbi:type VI secretion system ImpA family N-terminal domain-containing protein [Caballeronia sp. LZ034LL]|uniref:type VI secretion system protein TssA n=1 Tax=Caballeronia sp. LZ034LL TaxID=3038567 RepID=UPI00285A77D8|nr:type VI secretion system ImpA family N-terminal domain-containing protein [Caballeronia sp. LZ034LL]MDR5836985.1 type VI secretion system ImpA family N-terminal domain-containing protein [Caballeronia sp. LZ034LL]